MEKAVSKNQKHAGLITDLTIHIYMYVAINVLNIRTLFIFHYQYDIHESEVKLRISVNK